MSFDTTIVTEPSNEDKQSATMVLMQYTLSIHDKEPDVSEAVKAELDDRLRFAGYNKDGENVWERTNESSIDIERFNDDHAVGVATNVEHLVEVDQSIDEVPQLDFDGLDEQGLSQE